MKRISPGDPQGGSSTEKLHPDFAEHYNAEELAVSHTHLVSSKNAGAEVLKLKTWFTLNLVNQKQ